ncbi:MAG TPA: radical SAM protein [Thermoanaerobaculia bacterium]|nr:radical SAM protein [Thermoanaerobaculia bacterium]
MRRLRIVVIDLVSKGPTRATYARLMNANFASIMPQVVAVWCTELGHDVSLVCYTGFEDLMEELPRDVDLVFVGAFTEAAHTAYAVSALLKSRGAVTVLGGPHARCYPQDAARYFDYVLGFTDKPLVEEVLRDCAPHRPRGALLSAKGQPETLPGVRERWPFLEAILRKAPALKIVSMIGSLGCPYSCSFCIDSTVPFRPFDPGVLKEDLSFLVRKFRHVRVGWHDPNFGVRFDEVMDAIETVVPPGRADFIAESSLSLLSEARLKRLRRNGFKALLSGIESWYGLDEKSRTGTLKGIEKVRRVADHVNLILRYVPYVQANFVLGLDVDEGSSPFELTKRFVDLTPAAYPSLHLLTAFGQAAPVNLGYQRANRVTGLPFHFLNNSDGINVRPKNYAWREFFDHVIDLTRHALSWRAITRRWSSGRGSITRGLHLVRAVSAGGHGWLRSIVALRRQMDADPEVLRFFEGGRVDLPGFFERRVRRDLGPLWEWLPAGALTHDPNEWLAASGGAANARSA